MDTLKTLRRLRRYGINPVLIIAFAAMIILSLSRLILSLWQWESIPDGGFATILLQGIRVDFASVCALFGLPVLVLIFLSLVPYLRMPRMVLVGINVYCSLAIAFLILNEAATPEFIKVFGTRPNYIFVQYMLTWDDLVILLWSGHKLKLLTIFIIVIVSLFISFKLSERLLRGYHQGRFKYNVICLLIALCTIPLGVRSSFESKPFNPSMVAFTNNPLVNALPLNSSYTIVYDAFHLRDLTAGADSTYKIMSDAQAFEGVLSLSKRAQDPDTSRLVCRINQFINPVDGIYNGYLNNGTRRPILRDDALKAGKKPRKDPYNVVIIIEESLGDEFLKSQGGIGVTPNLEALRDKGWWFENMYATGHRTTRGIEAVAASFTPSSQLSIVQHVQPETPYATLAEIFSQHGFDTSFIYGGDSQLYNMKTFFEHNGTAKVIDERDFEDPQYVGSWGVSDEDLFNKAHQYYRDLHKQSKHFFSVILTTSLRDPYDIPDDKVSLDGIETTNEDRDLAAKYADYALGKFLEQAASEGYYQDTIFLVIANHVSSVKPGMEFPVDDFTIPAVIIAPNVMPHVDHRQVSQIDMGMTLLALNGIKGSVPNVGQDLTKYNIKERAIMQLNNTFALLIGDRMIELSPNTKPVFYNVEYQDGRVIATKDTSKRSSAQKEDDDELLYHAERINNIGPFMFRTESMSKRCLRLKVPQAQK